MDILNCKRNEYFELTEDNVKDAYVILALTLAKENPKEKILNIVESLNQFSLRDISNKKLHFKRYGPKNDSYKTINME